MLREAQRRFREGYHPECQWSIRQQGDGQESTVQTQTDDGYSAVFWAPALELKV